jgi:hypothetical protein
MSIITTPGSTISMNNVREALDVAIDALGSDGLGGTKTDSNRLGHTNYTTAATFAKLPISFNDTLVRRLANGGGIAKVNSISMRDMTVQKGPGPYSSSDGQPAAYCSGSTLKRTLNDGKYGTYNADISGYGGCAFTVYVLVVGGGGGGGGGRRDRSGGAGGGGGGGGVYQNSFSMTKGDFPFTIKVGGGGGGGAADAANGSGGGSSIINTALNGIYTGGAGGGGGSGDPGQGGYGGSSGGGSGNGGRGYDDAPADTNNGGGTGAKWTNNNTYYGGGGGGGGDGGSSSPGGAGGGGSGQGDTNGYPGTDGLGGGGGGGASWGNDSSNAGGSGGSGTVIVAYAVSNGKRLSGGTESSDSSYYYHTYTTVGGNQTLTHP